MAYISVFQIVIVLGQNILLQNSFFTHKKNYKLVWKRSFGLMTIAGFISSVIFFIIIRFTMMEELGEHWFSIFVMVGLYLTFSPIDTVVVNYYVLKEKALRFAYGAALSGLITVLVTLITIRYLKIGYLGWIICLPISILVSYLYYFRRIFIEERIFMQLKLKKNFVVTALKIGLPLTPHSLSLYILGISDRLLLQYLRVPINSIGFYSQGYNLGSQGNIVVNGIFQSLTRKMQDGFRNDTDYNRLFIRKLMIFVPLLISVIMFSGSLWAREVFLFLFRKPELRMAYPVTIVVLCSFMFWSIYTFFTFPLTIKNKTFSVSVISLTAAGVNIIGNIIFIPYFGIWAALGVTYFSYMIFGFAGLLNKENREYLNKYVNIIKLCIVLFAVNILLFAISWFSQNADFMLKGAITLLLLAVFGLFTKKFVLKKNDYALSDI
jgi:O-antigen/teichoic acid export membrane protein